MAKPNKPTNPRWNVGSPTALPVVGATLSWAAPTTNSDGSPLTGGDAISYYRVEWGTAINGAFGVFINSARTSATSYIVSDLPAGSYAFRVIAVAVDGEESNPLFLGTKVIA
jgi:predicted phage tail protein